MRRRPDHQVLSLDAMLDFIEVLRNTGKVTVASDAIGISTTTAHQWKNRSERNPGDPRYLIVDPLGEDPDTTFHRAWVDAKAESIYLVRDVAMDLATGRHRKPIVFQGEVMMERDYTAEPKLIGDELVYPIKLDDLGQPVPLTVPEVSERVVLDMLKTHDPDWRPKQDVDITSSGKPLMIPQRAGSLKEFLADFGRDADEELKAK